MAKQYLERLRALMARARGNSVMQADMEVRHFFSGAAVYVNGKICMSLTPVGFAIKLPEKYRTTLLKQGRAKPLRYFPNGPIKKDYVILPGTILRDARALRRWVAICAAHAASSQVIVKKNKRKG